MKTLKKECDQEVLLWESAKFLVKKYIEDTKPSKDNSNNNSTSLTTEQSHHITIDLLQENISCKQRFTILKEFLDKTKDVHWIAIGKELGVIETIASKFKNIFSFSFSGGKASEDLQDISFFANSGPLQAFKNSLLQGKDPQRLFYEYITSYKLPCDLNSIELLTQNGASIKKEDEYKRNALHIACKNSDLEFVKYIINQDVLDINAAMLNNDDYRYGNVYDMTPLYLACTNQKAKLEIIELLLKNGANPNINVSKSVGYGGCNKYSLTQHLFKTYKKDSVMAINIAKLLFKYGANQPEDYSSLYTDDDKPAKQFNSDMKQVYTDFIKQKLLRPALTFILCAKADAKDKLRDQQKIGLLVKPTRNIILSFFFKSNGNIGEKIVQKDLGIVMAEHVGIDIDNKENEENSEKYN